MSYSPPLSPAERYPQPSISRRLLSRALAWIPGIAGGPVRPKKKVRGLAPSAIRAALLHQADAIAARKWAKLCAKWARSDTRQQIRRRAFMAAFEAISQTYPGEPRARRRRMAWQWVRNHHRQLLGVPEYWRPGYGIEPA